mgnify:CR=1 FL=1
MDNEEEKTVQLTEKQRVFVERYCVHFNGAKACREAGYSEETARTMAHENLTKPDISEAINAKLRVLSMSAEEATKRLTDMGRGSIESFLNVDENGRVVIDLSKDEARENLGLIKKIKQTKKEFSEGAIIEIVNEVELHDAKDAILNLLKMHGKFNLKQEIEQTVKMETVTLFELPKNGRDENT